MEPAQEHRQRAWGRHISPWNGCNTSNGNTFLIIITVTLLKRLYL